MENYSIVGLNDASQAGVTALRWEFAELEKRAKKSFDSFKNFFLPIHVILSVITGLIFGIINESIFVGLLLAICYGFFGGMLLTFLIAGIPLWLFEKSIERLWLFCRSKRKWYARYEYLGIELERINLQIGVENHARLVEKEREAVQKERLAAEKEEYEKRAFSSTYELLDKLRPFHDGTHKELFQIHQFFSRKTKWFDKYRTYEDRLGEIIERAEISISELDYHERQASEFPERLGLTFRVFKALVVQQISTSERLLGDFETMKDWTSRVGVARRSSTQRSAGNSRPRIETARVSRPTVAQSEDSTEDYDFSQPETIQQPVVVAPPPPPKRRVLNKQLKKIPFEDYVGAAKLKMETGELGEIIVLHYEIRRVEEETGRSGAGQVRRVSEESDSYGYDIESFSQDESVYIEVKSTEGPFWSPFFLTANERKVMRAKGERYWLYRIFDMSKEDGSAKLSVFRGEKEILTSLRLEPTNYELKPYLDDLGDAAISFETLD